MIFFLFMALKISYFDLMHKKIKNLDLLSILVFSYIKSFDHQYLYSLATFLIGVIFMKYIGAGDIKFLSLIVLIHPSLASTLRSFKFISLGLLVLAVLYFKKRASWKSRIPVAPAISLGLIL